MTRSDNSNRGHGPVKVIYRDPTAPRLDPVEATCQRLAMLQDFKRMDGQRQRGGFSPNMRVKGGR